MFRYRANPFNPYICFVPLGGSFLRRLECFVSNTLIHCGIFSFRQLSPVDTDINRHQVKLSVVLIFRLSKMSFTYIRKLYNMRYNFTWMSFILLKKAKLHVIVHTSLISELTYQHTAFNAARCSDKCWTARYVKRSMCVQPAIHNILRFMIGQNYVVRYKVT